MRCKIDEFSSRSRLLEYLAESEGNFIPGSVLTEKLDFSRQALFKLVCGLRKDGIEIESIPQKGYMLKNIRETDSMSSTLIDFFLKDNPVFNKSIYFPIITSTQHAIKRLAQQNAPEGIVAVADEQTEGRGRRGRSWHAPASKNLLFSFLLKPELKPGDVQLLNLAAGIAVKSLLKDQYRVDAVLKWPNDLLVNERKICGILSEAAGEPDRIYYAVTGIGLNVNFSEEEMPEEVKEIATSLRIQIGHTISRPLLLSQILDNLASSVLDLKKADGKERLLSSYRKECDTLGREVSVIEDEKNYTGTAIDVTDQGALVVKVGKEEKIFAAADVHHLRMK